MLQKEVAREECALDQRYPHNSVTSLIFRLGEPKVMQCIGALRLVSVSIRYPTSSSGLKVSYISHRFRFLNQFEGLLPKCYSWHLFLTVYVLK